MLRQADDHLAEHAPGGILIQGSGGQGRATFTPWVGFFDPDETVSPERGVYVVYLFTEDHESVVLTLNQGMTELTRTIKPKPARQKLKADAQAIRRGLPSGSLDGLQMDIALGRGGFRQRAYEVGNIAAMTYRTGSLPDEAVLRSDLSRFLKLYQAAVEVKRYLLQQNPGVVSSPSVIQQGEGDPLRDFKPKDSGDYVAYLTGKVLRKSRRHEALVDQYGRWAAGHGFFPSTKEHPRDLVIRSESAEWLVEAKILYGGNATEAVRAAIGQLFTYRHLWYPQGTDVSLLALFSEPIGQGYVQLLDSLGIASVWKEEGSDWVGSTSAIAAGLAKSLSLQAPS